MLETENLTVLCVPPSMFGAAWLACGEIVREAVRTAGGLGDVVQRVEDADLQLWLVCTPAKPLAACFTDINIEDDGGRFVGVYGLNGERAKVWALALADRLAEFAREERCSRVLFKGRKAWARLLPSFRVIGQDGAERIWERAVQ